MMPVAPLTLLDHETRQEEVRDAFRRWHEALRENATPLGIQRFWIDGSGPQVGLLQLNSANVHGQFDRARFRPDQSNSSSGWTVEINLSLSNGGDSRLARDGEGHTWLLRRGHLQGNGETGPVDEVEFQDIREPLAAEKPNGGSDPHAWYPVAMLDGPPVEVRQQTSEFVRLCGQVRELLQLRNPSESTQAPPSESTRAYLSRRRELEQLVEQRQGKVWDRLAKELRAAGIEVEKKPSLDGFSCDIWVKAKPEPLLVEIKTGTSPHDVYTGVGQLMVYPSILPGISEPFRRVLLVPEQLRQTLEKAVTKLGISVHYYVVYDNNWEANPLNVTFEESFRRACGLPLSILG